MNQRVMTSHISQVTSSLHNCTSLPNSIIHTRSNTRNRTSLTLNNALYCCHHPKVLSFGPSSFLFYLDQIAHRPFNLNLLVIVLIYLHQ
ncbi:hypothetical protein EYC84_010786 [Monilinia fructicola]|uniref:Uncharacterized protein n=1 Tax=Monilinia fructicola TaxID=38448 RepID=A0A5M9J780_MONFR|nr:hypothetical protein EYC84_010786 [Monilinia fructicola]